MVAVEGGSDAYDGRTEAPTDDALGAPSRVSCPRSLTRSMRLAHEGGSQPVGDTIGGTCPRRLQGRRCSRLGATGR